MLRAYYCAWETFLGMIGTHTWYQVLIKNWLHAGQSLYTMYYLSDPIYFILVNVIIDCINFFIFSANLFLCKHKTLYTDFVPCINNIC